MKRTLAFVAALALHLVAAGAVMAEQPESPPPGMAKYLVVLWEPGTPVPGEKGKTASGKDPEFGRMGGRVLFSRGNRRVIYLPRGEAKGLRRHESVSYVQRIWAGEPLTGWVDEEPDSHSRFEAETEATNLTWGPVVYGYDSAGNIKSAGQDRYTYDSAGRLIEALVGGRTESYEYDSFGNMTKKLNGVAPTTMQIDGTSNRLTGPEYDVAGNLLSTADREYYTYDSLGMMVTSDRGSSSLRYIYDANEERVGRLVDTLISRWTVRDLEGRVLREFKSDDTGEGSYWYWEQDYVYADGLLVGGETQKWGAPQYGGRRHYHLDHLGSIRMVTTDTRHALARRDYYPFGIEQTASWQEQLDPGSPHVDDARFTGHERDFHSSAGIENNDYLDYMHARYYDPHRGRFLSVDPARASIDPGEPQSWNRYAYTQNNPVTFIDPDGRERKIHVFSGLFIVPPDNVVKDFAPYFKKSSGMDLVVTQTRTEKAVFQAFGKLDPTDIAILSSHGGGPNFQVQGGKNSRDTFNVGEIISAVQQGTGTPQAIVFAGCSTAEAAQKAAKALNMTTFGTTASSYSPENALAAAVLADVFARTGDPKLAVQRANAIMGQAVCEDGICSEKPRYVYFTSTNTAGN